MVSAAAADWALYCATSDNPPFTRHLLGATPWEDPEVYRRASAITYLQRARTPTLILHGGRDRRVPPANAPLLYRGLKDHGVPTELLVYPGVGHAPERPRTQRALQEQTYAWLGRCLWGGRAAAAAVRGSGAKRVADL